MQDILKLIDAYGREAHERLGKQASSGNREAAEILVKLAANCVWSRNSSSKPTETEEELRRQSQEEAEEAFRRIMETTKNYEVGRQIRTLNYAASATHFCFLILA